MHFRRLMIKNVHYMRTLSDEIVNEMICHLEVKRFAKDSIILKSGDVCNKLNFVRHGEIDVLVTNKVEGKEDEREELHFDKLNTGSCFCAYTFISDDAQQLQFLKARTNCIIESISREDMFKLAKKYY